MYFEYSKIASNKRLDNGNEIYIRGDLFSNNKNKIKENNYLEITISNKIR